jgi:hypothetical protein
MSNAAREGVAPGVRGKGFQGKAIAHPINFDDPTKTKGTAE